MAHNRKLVLSGIALVKARLRHDIQALSAVRDEIEKLIIDSNFLSNAPFTWIGLSIRFGLQNKFVPTYQGINKTHGDLSIAVEIDTHPLIGAGIDTYQKIFRIATVEALLHVAGKYGLVADKLAEYRQRLSAEDYENRP